VPPTCPGVAREILDPRNTWEDKEAFDFRARSLADDFATHFDKAYGNKGIDPAIVSQCPGK
jgi:phosphoenolpyruvate carboxykinase (ATP)